MVTTMLKDGVYIVTINPQTKKEKELLSQLLDMDEKSKKEHDYWTLPPTKKNVQANMFDDGFIPLEGSGIDETEIPFADSGKNIEW